MELSVDVAVAPAKAGGEVRQETARRQQQPAPQGDSAGSEPVQAHNVRTVRNIEIDPVTRDVIFQSISKETGEVVAQVPTEQQLKIRQYTRTGEVFPATPHRTA